MTSKAFRKHLLDPESLSLWTAARKRLELPNLSVKMTEPQYAHLMFSKICEVSDAIQSDHRNELTLGDALSKGCGSKKVQAGDFYLRKVLCKTCREKHWIEIDWKWEEDNPELNLHAEVGRTALTTPCTAKEARYAASRTYAYRPAVEELSARLWELYPESGKVQPLFSIVKEDELDEEDDEEKFLRELKEENDRNLHITSTRTRQIRRPSHISSATPSQSVNKADESDESDEEDKEEPIEVDKDVEVVELESEEEEEEEGGPVSHDEFIKARTAVRAAIKSVSGLVSSDSLYISLTRATRRMENVSLPPPAVFVTKIRWMRVKRERRTKIVLLIDVQSQFPLFLIKWDRC